MKYQIFFTIRKISYTKLYENPKCLYILQFVRLEKALTFGVYSNIPVCFKIAFSIKSASILYTKWKMLQEYKSSFSLLYLGSLHKIQGKTLGPISLAGGLQLTKDLALGTTHDPRQSLGQPLDRNNCQLPKETPSQNVVKVCQVLKHIPT